MGWLSRGRIAASRFLRVGRLIRRAIIGLRWLFVWRRRGRRGDIVINHSDNIRTSFPDFIKLANRVGMRVVEEEMEEEEEAS